MAKKIFLLSGIIFFIVLTALLVFKFFINGEKSKTVEGVINNANVFDDKSEPTMESRISKVITSSVKNATISENATEILYYENQNFISANVDGSGKRSVGAYPFSNVKSIQWHPKKSKAIVNDSGNYFVYSFAENTVVQLKKLDVVIWDTFGEKVIYKFYDENDKKRKIAMAKEDGSEEQILIQDVPFQKVDIQTVPKSNDICFYPLPEAQTEGILECIDTRSKEKKVISTGLFGADYKWSPNGKLILVSYLPQEKSNVFALGTMNETGGELTGLMFSTNVQKCVWTKDSKSVFCGALTGLPEHAVVPNDWESRKYYSADTFWKVSVYDKKKKRIVDLEEISGKIDAVDFFADQNEKNLFFTDRLSGNLYRIRF